MGRTGIGVIWLCVCCVIQTSLGQLVNVARGKTYNQSSYYDNNHPSSNAANGNTGGDYNSNNCIHTGITGSDFEPWWQVDLGRNYPVYNVTVWARTYHASRLYPLNITVDGQQCVRATSVRRQQSLSCTSPITGRVVRLTRDYRDTGDDITLNLCEVQIWSTCQAGDYSNGTACVPCSTTCENSLCNSSTGRCDNCDSGSYKLRKECVSCNSNCVSRRCNPDSGRCTYGCNAGFYSDLCNVNCTALTTGCYRCDQDGGQCTECNSGSYISGASCVGCSSNCVSTQCNLTDGYCTQGCNAGWYGNRCNSRCSDRTSGCTECAQNGGECTVCSGHFKPPQCTECTSGYYKSGASCFGCNSNCVNRQCDSNNGYCTQGCSVGWYGDRCNSICSALTSRCTQCVQDGGQCTVCSGHFKPPQCTECNSGYYVSGTSCVGCSSYCVNRECNSTNGYCTRGCTEGWYGDKCYSSCSALIWRCTQCVQDGGQCTVCSGNLAAPQCTDCIDGFYKKWTLCTVCTWKCDKDAPCNKTTGNCAECPPGKKGDRCDQDCDNNHYGPSRCSLPCGQCNGSVQCDPATGHCQHCEPGWYLPLCENPCTDNTYGINCSQSCGQCKGGQACDPQTGKCTAGCGPGFKSSDVLCKTKCDSGTHGENCSLTCGHCQGKDPCDHVTGECETGCLAGFSGAQCLSATPPEDSIPSAAVGAVVGVLLIIIIVAVIVVVVVVFRRRRQRAGKSSATAGETAEMSSNMEEKDGTKSNVGSHTPLSFDAVAVDGNSRDRDRGGDIYENVAGPAFNSSSESADKKKSSAPKLSAQPSNGKPSSGADGKKKKKKPLVSAKPAQPAGVMYENVPAPRILETDTDKPADSTAKTSAPKTSSQPSHGNASSGTDRKKKLIKPPTADKPGKGKKAARASDDNKAEPEDFGVEENVYGNDPKFFKAPKSLVLNQLQESVADKLRGTTLEEEFRFMEPVKAFSMKQGEREENYYKNRFKTILPYDNNRIQLDQVDGDDASDFVNASFIKGFNLEKGYIAAQGPKQNTLDDFWRMVWQEKVTDIVMLTNLKEGKKNKCSEYWPAERAVLKTRHMEVTGVGEETRAHFVIRTFDIKHKEDKDKRRLKQYHYVSWIDHEVPAITPLINFWRYVRTYAPRLPSSPPLLVHCSAGVGRTGTFIALDIAIDESEQASEVNLFNIVDRLRDDRCFMVQNQEQYSFLHEAVLEAYTSRATRIEVAAIGTVLPASFNRNTPNAKIDAEYEMLNKMRNCPIVPTYTMANMSENAAKNRNSKVLPNDKHVVFITRYVSGRNQYINGVSMTTFKHQRGSIMTQLPLTDTLVDLWRLVDGSDVKLIVSLGDVEGKQDMFCYWPKTEGNPLQAGPYVIKLKSSSKLSSSLRSYKLNLDKDDTTQEVRVLHYSSWTGECADNTDELIHLLTLLQEADEETGGNPVIIQCIDGSLKSGVLCALWDVVSRMTHDEELDVYLAARMVTMARPEAFVSVEQYRYCYEVAEHIKISQNVYSNV